MCIIAAFTSDAVATPLPASVQADLIVKVAAYDRNMRGRAGDRIRVLLVTTAGDDDPRWAMQMRAALAQSSTIAGLPHTATILTYPGADELAKRTRAERIAIVIVSSSLTNDVEAIRRAFEGADVLTVAPASELARKGIVLGFELISGKPRMFFNLEQSKRQSVAMSADVLKLMTLVP